MKRGLYIIYGYYILYIIYGKVIESRSQNKYKNIYRINLLS